MLALVIGYGSIGARHARLLHDMGHEVACVTQNSDCPFPAYATIKEALAANSPWLAVVSTATADHHASLKGLCDASFSGHVLVEKPLFDTDKPLNCTPGKNTFVGYNLRFHPLVTRTRELLAGQAVLNAQFHVGQYLPDWRPGSDYTASYSARHAQGGGVVRDLSHELDLALFLFGKWHKVTALAGKFSDLSIDSDDQASILMETSGCPLVTIHMDYLSRIPRRGFDVTTPELSLRADFMAGTLTINGSVEEHPTTGDTTYKKQLLALVDGGPNLCGLDQGLEIVRLIQAVETAATTRTWVWAQ